MAEPITLLWAVLAAVLYAVVFYAKAWATTNPPEKFVPEKFLATVIVGAFVGAVFWLGNLSITQDAVIDQLTDYAIATAVLESFLKMVFAKLGWTWPGNPPPTPVAPTP